MYNILLLHDVEIETTKGVLRWAYANRTYALKRNSPSDMRIDRRSTTDFQWRRDAGDYDLIYCLDYTGAMKYKRERRGSKLPLIVTSFNKDRRSRQGEFRRAYTGSDWLVINNENRWLAGMQTGETGGCWSGVLPHTCCIANGVDEKHWRVARPVEERSKPARVLWTGGVGPEKGKRYHEVMLPLKLLLEERGEYRCDFRPVREIEPRQVKTPDEMLDWYNDGTFVVCASLTEGTPSYILEAMACGCIPIMTDVGNAPEIFGGVRVYRPGESFATVKSSSIHVMDICEDSQQAKLIERRIRKFSESTIPLGEQWARYILDYWSYGAPAYRAEYFYSLWRKLINDGPDSIEPFTYTDGESLAKLKS